MLAEPFLRGKGAPADTPLGTFAYRGRVQARETAHEVTGWMTLRDAAGDLSGVLALPPPVVDALLADAYPRTESLAVVGRAWADAPFVVLAAPNGLLPVALTRTADGLDLVVELGPVELRASLAPQRLE
jgi:hypothetical protein